MNPYEWSELEGRALCCENCGTPISVAEYDEWDGLCESCANENIVE